MSFWRTKQDTPYLTNYQDALGQDAWVKWAVLALIVGGLAAIAFSEVIFQGSKNALDVAGSPEKPYDYPEGYQGAGEYTGVPYTRSLVDIETYQEYVELDKTAP